MTNFSNESRQGLLQWLTPERAVQVLPLLAGIVVAGLIVPAGVWPLSERVSNQQAEVDGLRTKSIAVPQMSVQFVLLSARQRLREQQLDRLLALVAGTSELNTFLSELDDLANANGVVITTTEPGDVQRFIPQSSPAGAAPPPSGDALLNKGLEKRSARLNVQGGFLQVYGFLRALERLQVFVIISEMNIKAQAQAQKQNDEVASPQIRMSLTLTAYGRQTDEIESVDQQNQKLKVGAQEAIQPLDPS